MHDLLQDIRYAVRTLTRTPAFTIVAVLTLALGIGANTAIFSALYGVLLRPLPYPGSDRLVGLSYTYGGYHDFQAVTYPAFQYLHDHADVFDALAASTPVGVTLSTNTEAVHLGMARVSREYFRALGVAPAIGRSFLAEEDQPGGPSAVVLSDGLWRRSFGGDAKVLDRAVLIDGTPCTVVGVMPAGFRPPDDADVWSTLAQVGRTIGSGQNLAVIGRLAPGLTLAQAAARLRPVLTSYAETFHRGSEEWLSFDSYRALLGREVRAPLRILFGAIAFVLLIACANVASLLLGRAVVRGRELSVRASLGATRGRLVRQLLSESLVLALIGGALGVAVATWGLGALRSIAPGSLPASADIRIDGWALGFTLGLSVLTGIGFGLLPAWQASRFDLYEALKAGAGRTATGRGRVRQLLVTGEIALALVLLVGAGLLIRTVANLVHSDPGFDPRRVLAAEIWLTGTRYESPSGITAYYDELRRRVGALPGVASAAVIEAGMPLARGGNTGVSVGGGELRGADYRAVSPEFFATLGVPLRQGRYLEGSDRAGSEPVVAVNDAFVHRYLSDRDPVGAAVTVNDVGGPRRVVGVVGDVTSGIGRAAPPTVFIPASQEPAGVALAFNGWFPIHLLVRTAGDPASVSAAVARAVRATDPQVPVGRVRTMGEVLAESLALRRFVMMLLSLFAGLAAVLAAVGIYGLMSYLVTQRAREFGIRMALGARPGDVVAMVARRGAVLVGAGVILGVLAAGGLTRLLASQLFGVRPIDPVTFAAVMVGVVAVALVACSVPAWRGTKVDPVVALRSE